MYNILIFPVAILVRAPILILAYSLIILGQQLEYLGGRIPGLRRTK